VGTSEIDVLNFSQMVCVRLQISFRYEHSTWLVSHVLCFAHVLRFPCVLCPAHFQCFARLQGASECVCRDPRALSEVSVQIPTSESPYEAFWTSARPED